MLLIIVGFLNFTSQANRIIFFHPAGICYSYANKRKNQPNLANIKPCVLYRN